MVRIESDVTAGSAYRIAPITPLVRGYRFVSVGTQAVAEACAARALVLGRDLAESKPQVHEQKIVTRVTT